MPRSPTKIDPKRRSDCPLSCALDLLGDRWTILVIRDLFGGKTRFGEFLESGERVPTNILAERLKRLQEAGVIKAEVYQNNPPRSGYHLTAMGKELKSVLGPLAMWSARHIPQTKPSAQMRAALSE